MISSGIRGPFGVSVRRSWSERGGLGGRLLGGFEFERDEFERYDCDRDPFAREADDPLRGFGDRELDRWCDESRSAMRLSWCMSRSTVMMTPAQC